MFRPPTKYSEYLQDVRKSIDYILKRVNATTVTQIVAGTNVTISPASGTGVVTINASGGGGGGLPAGGTTGQILAKINNVDYNAEWIDNYALWTSTVKHEVKAGEAINKGQAVYVSSADGTNMIVSKASNALEATSSKTLGILAQSLAHNAKGFVITEGLLAGLDTSAAGAAGDPVWLGTDGNLLFGLANKPYAPANMVSIGVVTRKNSSNGEIFVRIQNGFELDELHNVDARNPNNNDGIFYNSTTQLWEHKPVSAVYATPTLAQVTTAGNTTTNAITVGGLTVATNLIYTDTVNGRVGIGTTTPIEKVDIATSADNQFALVLKSVTGRINFKPYLNATYGALIESTNLAKTAYNPLTLSGSKMLMLDGNVIIGATTDDGFKLSVNGTARVQGNFQVSAGVARFTSTIYPNIEVNSTQRFSIIEFLNTASAKAAVALDNTDKYLDLSGYPTYGVRFNVNNLEAARFNNLTRNFLIGTTTDGTAKLTVAGSITAASALAQGVYFNNTLVAAANNDVLVGLDINPTFTNGAFTGVQNYAARLINSAGVNVLFATGVNNSGTHKITFSNAGVTTNSFISSVASGTFSNMNLVLGQAFFNGSTVNTTNNIVIQSNSSTVFEPRTAISYAYLTGDAYVVTAVNNTNAVLGFSNGSNATSTRGAAIFAIAGGSFASTARLDFAISNVNAPVVTTADVAMSLFNSKNFAIGTTTDAGYKLDVNGTSRFTQAVVVNAGGVKTESGTITAQTGVNSGRMTMFNLRNTGGGYQSAVGASLAIAFTNRDVSGLWTDDVIENIVHSNTAGAVTTGYNFYTHNNQAYNASPVLAMSINGLNVGIGTTTPTDKLHIVDNTNGNKFGRISAGGTDASAAWVAQNDQVDNIVYRVFGSAVTGTQMGISLARSASLMANLGGSGKFLVGTFSSTDFVMGTGNQERMRLVDSTGNFLVGTTTDLGNKLEVSGTINATAYKINNTAGYTGILNIPTNPPGQQNIDIQGGIVVNIF